MQNPGRVPSAVVKQRRLIYRITTSAVFLSIALVLKLTTTFYLPILGASGLKIDFSGIFSAFPSLLFGPWYGGAVCALADVLGAVIKPSGAYIPLLTLTQFLSGFLVGVMWKLLYGGLDIKRIGKRFTVCAAVFLTALGCLGIVCHISLVNDGVLDSFMVSRESLPLKGELNGTAQNSYSLSPVSKFVCGLAGYSNDSLTVTLSSDNPDTKMVIIPAAIDTSDGQTCKVAAIASGAFDRLNELHTVYIPASVTSIAEGIFDGASENLTIYTPEGSTAEQYAHDNDIICVAMDEAENDAFLRLNSSFAWKVDGYSSNDNYRKNLSGYIRFMTVGLELAALLGLGFIALGWLSGRRSGGVNGYVVMLATIFLPRFLVTTINTEILRQTLAVWNGRAFWVLWIPRAGEEIINGVISAYVISLLYSIYEKKIAPKLPPSSPDRTLTH